MESLMDLSGVTRVDHAGIEPAGLATTLTSGHGHSAGLAALEETKAHDLVTVFKLLADETRLRILHYLTQKPEMNVCTFVGLLHQTQPAVSHHLALLREAGLVECRRDGKHNFYHLVPARCQMFLDTAFGMAR
jgi:DNA-binding transcriptional ArsR family regulator